MEENLRREIILDHYQNPKNKESVTDERYLKANTNNESCIILICMFFWKMVSLRILNFKERLVLFLLLLPLL